MARLEEDARYLATLDREAASAAPGDPYELPAVVPPPAVAVPAAPMPGMVETPSQGMTVSASVDLTPLEIAPGPL